MYLLDTNILSELIKKKPNRNFLRELKNKPAELLYTTVISVMELRSGCARRPDKELLWKRIEEEILHRVQILSIGPREAIKAGDLIGLMFKQGTPIGIEDVLIASVGICQDLTIITANIRHFSQLPGVKIENWLE